MKLKYLAIVVFFAAVTLGCTKEVTSNQTDTQTPSAINTPSKVAESGKFQAGEHATEGKVSVVTEKEKRFLEFDQNFKTNEGPDLYVILYRSDKPPVSGIKEKDYVSVARLQKISGNQRYILPTNVKPNEFKSVAIWCRKFNATFGYASLSV